MNTRLTGTAEVRKVAHAGRTILYFMLCAVLAGCASLPAPPAESVRVSWGNMAIAPARFPPQSNIRTFATSKGAGTAKGAALGSTAGIAAAGVFAAAGGPFAIVLAPYMAVVLATSEGVMGAHLGSQAALSEQDFAAMEARIQESLTSWQMPGTLAQAIGDVTRQDTGLSLPLFAEAGSTTPEAPADYRALAQQGVDTVLEVVVSEVGFTGDKQLSFYVVAQVRVVRVSGGDPLFQREFVYQSDEHDTTRWGNVAAALLQAEWRRAYTSLAESVEEQLFLLTPLPLESRAKPSGTMGLKDLLGGLDACGLAWVNPKHDYRPAISDTAHRTWNRFPTVESRQPTLAWETFPRNKDRSADAEGILSTVNNVRYDLRVWQAEDTTPPTLVYERRDLPEASHTVELPLAASARYFWSARARFQIGGVVHSTKWGYFRTPNYEIHGKIKPEPSPAAVVQAGIAGAVMRDVCTLDFIPINNYYRFQTQ